MFELLGVFVGEELVAGVSEDVVGEDFHACFVSLVFEEVTEAFG